MKLKRKPPCKHLKGERRLSRIRVLSGTRAGRTVYGPPYRTCRKCGVGRACK